LFLIDGLDEVSDEAERKKMVADIRNFIIHDGAGSNRYIITCRIASYTSASRFEPIAGAPFAHYTVSPFNMGQIEKFLSAWYRWYQKEIHHRRETLESEAGKNLRKMMSAIRGDDNIMTIATNPLMLTILALIEHEGGELPRNRADLYAKCLKMLAGSWENLRSLHETEKRGFKLGGRRLSEDFIIEYLGPIAYGMHDSASPEIEYRDLKETLAKKFDVRNKDMLLSKEQTDDFIRIMRERSGLLEEVATGTYSFSHLTFKEYLTARMLS
ncbi:MAG: hypothetical protein GY859_05305, partial [Desulfobacterales bacterium]|nr:hypothetical protein [Desulfobacterales bacterium]